MTHARPNALSLAVAVAISSSIMATDALADRKLQTKSVDISGNEQVEFTQSEVIVKPTLDDDSQPIPKSFTTTYPDQTEVRAGYDIPSEGFTDVLSGIEGGVSSVDQFETDENDVALKYTKVLKVGNEGVFRFTHNLAEEKLLIEVRDGMTHQDSIETVCAQLGDTWALEPFTGIASPVNLVGVLKGANERAGNLGKVDQYVALATLEVDKVEVNGRTFMRLIAAGDQPPELKRLGQSLFVNDDALFAAATSAYTRVHVLGKNLQLGALQDLLSCHQPVGYVVHLEDETQAYAVPAGYPKLEVTETTGDIIVFRGQKQNPTDIALVEGLYDVWKGHIGQNDKYTAKVKKDKVKSYRYIIRSRQMTMLEDLAAKHDAGLNSGEEYDDKVEELAFFENLQQALASATSDGADEVEFTTTHDSFNLQYITPTWLHIQLFRHFGFKPVLRNFLTNRHFVQTIHEVAPSRTNTHGVYFNDPSDDSSGQDEGFAAKVTDDFVGQLLDMESKLENLRATEALLAKQSELTEQTLASASQSIRQSLRLSELAQKLISITDREQGLRQQPETIAGSEEEIDRRPAHPETMPEVLEKLTAVEKALKMDGLNSKDDVYHRRNAIAENIHSYATKAIEEAEQEALDTLETVEEILEIEVNKEDSKVTRLNRVRHIFDCEIPEYMLREMEAFIWKIDMEWSNDEKARAWNLRDFLDFHVDDPLPDARVLRQQERMLEAVENELNIDKSENPSAKERGKDTVAELALVLKVEFDKGTSLNDQKNALKSKIQALDKEANDIHGSKDFRRERNNKIARQLNINCERCFNEEDKIGLIEAKLRWLDRGVDMAGRPYVDERIAAIENELDRQIARGSEPRYIPEPEVATDKPALEATREEVATDKPSLKATGEEVATDKPSLEATGEEVATDKPALEATGEEVATDKPALKATGEEVENKGGSFQYTPEQAEVLYAIHLYAQQHPLKRQALQVANGLAELAVMHGKAILDLPTYDFDDEFASLRLHVQVGDKLSFDQTSRIVQIFRDLKTIFPEYLDEPCPLEEIQTLVHRARNEMGSGAEEYDKEIFGMGKSAIRLIGDEPTLKSFREYFATRSASGNRIITLLQEGLISKVELWNYIEAVRGIDDYQTVNEFEHFLGYKHSVKLTHFKAALRTLSNRGAGEFILHIFPAVTAPAAMKVSVAGMKEYAAAVIANYVLDDIAFDNGRRTAAFLANVQDTLAPYASAVGVSESELIKAIHDTLMQAQTAAVEHQLNDYWVKPSAFLVQAVTWYFTSFKPLLTTHTVRQAVRLSLTNMHHLYLLDLTNRGDYMHRMVIPFQHWMKRYGVDLDRTRQYDYHRRIEFFSEFGGLVMPLGKAASSVILLKTGSLLFARQYNANPRMYRSISRLVPEMVKSMASGQGVQVPLLHRLTPEKVKTLASATAGMVLGPVTTVGAYAHGLLSGFTYAQTFGFALASSLTFDFFMNDNKMLTQWLGGPLGRSLDNINRWRGVGESKNEYLQRTAIALPQGFSETDEEYTSRVKANNTMYGWSRQENYLQFRERRDRTMKMYEHGWEKYFRDNVPKWSFSHAESIPYFYTFGAFYEWQKGDDNKKASVYDERIHSQSSRPLKLPK